MMTSLRTSVQSVEEDEMRKSREQARRAHFIKSITAEVGLKAAAEAQAEAEKAAEVGETP